MAYDYDGFSGWDGHSGHSGHSELERETSLSSTQDSAWRLWWKSRAPANRVNVARGNHVADIELSPGVIELHEGATTADDVRARELLCEDLIWLVDGRELDFRRVGTSGRWQWVNADRGLCAAQSAVCFDLGGPVLVAERFSVEDGAVYLEGGLHQRAEVLEWFDLAS